jgi:amidophosphoribosyltransferase
MCGIIGLFGQSDVAESLVYGLTAVQHRGQDAAGVVTFDRKFYLQKGRGLVADVFRDAEKILQMKGSIGLGHTRYATQGSTELLDAQPFTMAYPFGMAMVHNGNVTNFEALREALQRDQHRVIETSNDLELLIYTLANELEQVGYKDLTPHGAFTAVRALRSKVEGAYSTITILAQKGLLAFRDLHGIRPLLYGRRTTAGGAVEHAFASESTVFDYLGFERVRDLAPGETAFIDTDGNIHWDIQPSSARAAFCSFEHIYFAREDSIFDGRVVAGERVRMGRLLATAVRAQGLLPDVVIDVPSSAYFAASALAEELGVPYRRGLTKNNHVGRSFIVPTQVDRERLVRQKLNPIGEVLSGKKVAIVDDSIVRGTTSKHIVRIVREAGASAVYMVSAAPPLRHPCVYGIDIARKAELIAATHDLAAVCEAIGADAVVYPEVAEFRELFAGRPHCFACLDGNYPTAVSEAQRNSIEREKIASGR